MNKLLIGAATAMTLTFSSVAVTPAFADPPRHAKAKGWHKNKNKHYEGRRYRDEPRRTRIVHVYDYNRPDPRYRGYYANRYYTSGYAPIRVSRGTRIYRGSNDRYYCRRSDGTTGLIVGAALGGLLGNQIARGSSTTIATVLGAGAGALLGRSIDRGDVTCR